MRVALVSPYSWTYPGGVTRHIEALARELAATGHEVRVFAPFDRDTRGTALLHRGARPQRRSVPEWLVPLGPTLGWPSNGAVSNLPFTPFAISTLRRELAAFAPDVVHVHEPVAPVVGWDVLTSADAPIVGTFHCYSEKVPPHLIAVLIGARRKLNHLNLRIAVSEAAAWTGRRFYGGHYRIVPNGVELPPGGVPAARRRAPGEPLRLAFVGQVVERKGLPVLLRAFEAVRAQVPVELTVVGASQEEIEPLLVDGAGVTALGRVDDAARLEALKGSDVLVAPSLGGESFGMVLTEAFAAGRPVVASNIAGYRDVVTDGVDGLLVPPRNSAALAAALVELLRHPDLGRRLGEAGRRTVENRFSIDAQVRRIQAVYDEELARAGVQVSRTGASMAGPRERGALELPPI
jgi:phosphatidyl-myo-inositol alpha-mannosyltransferase